MIDQTNRETVVVLDHAQRHLFPPTKDIVKQSTTLPYCLVSAPHGVEGIACLVCGGSPISYNAEDVENKYCPYGDHFFDDLPVKIVSKSEEQHDVLADLISDYMKHNRDKEIGKSPIFDLWAWSLSRIASSPNQPTSPAQPDQPPHPGEYFTPIINSPHFPFQGVLGHVERGPLIDPTLVYRQPNDPQFGPGRQITIIKGEVQAVLCLIFPKEEE